MTARKTGGLCDPSLRLTEITRKQMPRTSSRSPFAICSAQVVDQAGQSETFAALQTDMHDPRKYSTKWLTIEGCTFIFNHMVELKTARLDIIFHALGDATRRRMLRELARGERTVSQLAEPFAMSLAAASKHIKALENAGLIRREVCGRTHLCHLAPRPLARAYQWLSFYERFWTDRLDVLDRLLREEDARKSFTTKRGNDK
jgi:DNA-binding transcriptional ArsR family regulator